MAGPVTLTQTLHSSLISERSSKMQQRDGDWRIFLYEKTATSQKQSAGRIWKVDESI